MRYQFNNLFRDKISTGIDIRNIEPCELADNITEDEIEQARKRRANKDMLWGAVWCIGGTIVTLASRNVIAWGAILFGGIQFIKGVIASTK
ncbi:hypothetical protein [Flavobacterium sp.]|uniref:hypothetical protein n=1 Tax=Flavobacterium sp. TaxID=239 RepID=UPI003A8F54F7